MSILIVGKSEVNRLLLDRFNSENLNPITIENINNIKKIEGEVGSFKITLTDRNILATHIVITEEPVLVSFPEESIKIYDSKSSNNSDFDHKFISDSDNDNNIAIEDLPIFNLEQLEPGNGTSGISDVYSMILENRKSPIVFIMDYPEESQAYSTPIVLKKAVEFAKKKRKVFCLMKFIRTAGSEEGSLERLYRDARNSGVSFIRYNSLTINYDIEQSVFKIELSHKIGNSIIETDFIIAAGSFISGENLDKIAKMLRLKSNKDGFINCNYSFLYPTLTSRKGVFLLNAKLLPGGDEELENCINFTMSQIKEDIKYFSMGKRDSESHFYAKVDGEKCAFCYTCYRACPHHAMSPDYENSIMKCLKNACYGCGICASICPASAINTIIDEAILYDDNKSEIKDDVKIDVRKSFKSDIENYKSNTMKIICCENSGEIAVNNIIKDLYEEQHAEQHKELYKELVNRIEVMPVSCGGEISTEIILDSLRSYEKVLVITCIDEACKHFEGNERAKLYVERAKKFLKDSGLDNKRIEHIQVSHAMPYIVRENISLLINKAVDGKQCK